MKLTNVFDVLGKKLEEDIGNLSTIIPHPGESGIAKEEAIKEFLTTYLPERFGVKSGFVFDYKGNPSQQIDIIIYDRFIAPKFKIIGERYFFPCESVIAVGEVKTNLTKQKLQDAVLKISSVKRLDRTAGGKNKVRIGYQFKLNNEYLKPSINHVDNIFGFIFSFDSPSLSSVANNFSKEIKSIDEQYRANIICVLKKGIISFYKVSGANKGLVTDAYKADGVYYSKPSESNWALHKWFTLLSNDICDIHFSGIPYMEYFDVKKTENKRISFNEVEE